MSGEERARQLGPEQIWTIADSASFGRWSARPQGGYGVANPSYIRADIASKAERAHAEAIEQWKDSEGKLKEASARVEEMRRAMDEAVDDFHKADARIEAMRELLLDMPDRPHGMDDGDYTDWLTGADGTKKQPYPKQRNRQCSIGYHDECTDPEGEYCGCPCHCAALRDGKGEL